MISTAMPTQAARNTSDEMAFRLCTLVVPMTGQCSVSKKYQIEPQSAERVSLS